MKKIRVRQGFTLSLKKSNVFRMLSISKQADIQDIQEIWGDKFLRFQPLSYFESRQRDNRIFIARIKDKPVGFAIYDIWWGNCPFVELLNVHPDYQKQGIGRALMKGVINEAKTLGFKQLISSSELTNKEGQEFHSKLGFSRLKTLNLPHGEEQFFHIHL